MNPLRSIRTQPFDRTQTRGATRGQPARQKGDAQQEYRGRREDARVARADAIEERRDEPAAGPRSREADRDASERDAAPLSHDHASDGARPRAECETHAYFARALAHDVGHGAVDA